MAPFLRALAVFTKDLCSVPSTSKAAQDHLELQVLFGVEQAPHTYGAHSSMRENAYTSEINKSKILLRYCS